MREVAVVIPFFQRDRGILTRALDTVAAQSFKDLQIIVVDDASPLPPDEEVANRPQTERGRIDIVRRPNGGPGAARNSGLDAVDPSVDYIAFLDSDDRWEPGHLKTAVEGLDAGYDFFFADYTWPSGTSTRFRQTGLDKPRTPIAPGSSVTAYEGDFYEAILSSWPVHLSTTVIRKDTIGHIRFDERMKFSSEDMLYFLECASATDRVCYSRELSTRLDDGINIFRRQAVGSYEFSRSRLANAYFHRLIGPEAARRSGKVQAINNRLLRANYRDFFRSEAKSLLLARRLNVGLYPDFLKIFWGRKMQPPGMTG